MLLEIAVITGGLVTVFGMALRTAERLTLPEMEDHEWSETPEGIEFAEKRRVLERSRSEWVITLEYKDSAKAASKAMDEIDEKLLKLAEEESKARSQYDFDS